MNIIKKILLVLAALLLLIAAAGMIFFPGHVELRRAVTIQANQERVFDYLNTISNFNTWSPWYEMDTAAAYSFVGPSAGNGATMKWVSEKGEVGVGSMVITSSISPVSIKHDLSFSKNGKATGDYLLATTDSGTTVTWIFGFEAGANPLLRIMGAYIQEMVGADFDRGLAKLKLTLETQNVSAVDSILSKPFNE